MFLGLRSRPRGSEFPKTKGLFRKSHALSSVAQTQGLRPRPKDAKLKAKIPCVQLKA